MTDISIIVPIYNEQAVLDEFFKRVRTAFDSIGKYSYEIICINDGSEDATEIILDKYAAEDPRIKVISFSRNFGKEASMVAGLRFAAGRCAIPIDADLQDPPELIEKLLSKWEQGYDVVYAVRTDRQSDGFLKRKSSEVFYKFYNSVSERPMPQNAGDFRLISRRVIDAILRLKERALFMKGVFNWVGFKSCGIEYERPARAAGKTKWSYWRLWNFALDGITASSTLPLRIWTYIGGCTALISIIYAVYIVVRTLVRGVDVPGYASLIVSILFFGSIQLIALGIFGEYLGRLLTEVKNRPLYIIDKTVNFDSEPL